MEKRTMQNPANLFVFGCPRSGTTALGVFLATRQDVVLGIERYGHRAFPHAFSLTPELFEKDRFLSFESGDTFYDSFDFSPQAYKGVSEKFATARWVGDKIPRLYQSLPHLFAGFDQRTKGVWIFRNIFDVAASYKARQANPDDTWDKGVNAAISDWAESIRAYMNSAYQDRIILVVYEDFVADPAAATALLEQLELDHDADSKARLDQLFARSGTLEAARKRDLTMAEVMDISERAPFGGYRQIVDSARSVYR